MKDEDGSVGVAPHVCHIQVYVRIRIRIHAHAQSTPTSPLSPHHAAAATEVLARAPLASDRIYVRSRGRTVHIPVTPRRGE